MLYCILCLEPIKDRIFLEHKKRCLFPKIGNTYGVSIGSQRSLNNFCVPQAIWVYDDKRNASPVYSENYQYLELLIECLA